MRSFRKTLIALVACVAAPSWAASLSDDLLERMSEADVVRLGEIHDNPAHHETQRAALPHLARRGTHNPQWHALLQGQ